MILPKGVCFLQTEGGKVLFADYIRGLVKASLELLKNESLTTDMFNVRIIHWYTVYCSEVGLYIYLARVFIDFYLYIL